MRKLFAVLAICMTAMFAVPEEASAETHSFSISCHYDICRDNDSVSGAAFAYLYDFFSCPGALCGLTEGDIYFVDVTVMDTESCYEKHYDFSAQVSTEQASNMNHFVEWAYFSSFLHCYWPLYGCGGGVGNR